MILRPRVIELGVSATVALRRAASPIGRGTRTDGVSEKNGE
jgi:hypothetical protein